MMDLSSEEIGYIAGIIDGEGSLEIVGERTKRTYYYNPRMKITNTDLRLMLWLKERLGGSFCSPKICQSQRRKRYDYTLCSNGLRLLLPKVLPYLVIKAECANLLLVALEPMKSVMEKKDIACKLRALHIRNGAKISGDIPV